MGTTLSGVTTSSSAKRGWSTHLILLHNVAHINLRCGSRSHNMIRKHEWLIWSYQTPQYSEWNLYHPLLRLTHLYAESSVTFLTFSAKFLWVRSFSQRIKVRSKQIKLIRVWSAVHHLRTHLASMFSFLSCEKRIVIRILGKYAIPLPCQA